MVQVDEEQFAQVLCYVDEYLLVDILLFGIVV